MLDKNKIKKILCIKPRGIGDIVLSTIILDNLLSYFPNTKIDYLTEDFAASALSNNPLVNKVITFRRKDFILKTICKIRKEKYDLVFDLWSNPRTAQITFLSGIKYRIGYAYRGRKYAYNIKATSERGDCHSAEHNLELLKSLNIPIISKNIHFYCSIENEGKAKKFIQDNSYSNHKIIGIIPSGGWDSKRCDKEKWVEICCELIKNLQTKILILWGPGDEEDAFFIKDNLQNGALLIPKTSIDELAGYIKNCSLVIANDSGPMHISAAMNIPTIGLFGPTNPKVHGPYGKNCDYVLNEEPDCIICNKLKCPYNHECFVNLKSDLVVKKAKNFLNLNFVNA